MVSKLWQALQHDLAPRTTICESGLVVMLPLEGSTSKYPFNPQHENILHKEFFIEIIIKSIIKQSKFCLHIIFNKSVHVLNVL